MDAGWKESWEKYLQNHGLENVEGPLKINLGEIDFYIPPLLGITADDMKAIKKHNAKHRIFSDE